MEINSKTQFNELKKILQDKSLKGADNKSDLVNKLLSNIPLIKEKEVGSNVPKKQESDINCSKDKLYLENKRLYTEIAELRELVTELKNENSRLKMQLSHNISDSTNANTTVNHINVDIHSQEDLQTFMKFYKEVSQGNELPPTYNYKPNSF